MIQQFFFQHTYLIGIVSFLFGWMGMPVVLRIAKTKGFVVRPNKRMSHTGEIPNIGGLNICFSFLLSYMLFEFNQLGQNQFFLIGVFAIMAVGFIDDVLVLTPTAKLLGETLAGIAMIGFADLRITHLHGLFGIGEIGIVPSYLISLFVLVAIINAINLIDGVDGLASGLGILYCSFFAVWFGLAGAQSWSVLAICLIGALAVFFIYNVFGHRGKIFMGDSGSHFLGYLAAVISARVTYFTHGGEQSKLTLLIPLFILALPLFDTAMVVMIRTFNRKPFWIGDHNHISHRFVRMGLSRPRAVLLVHLLALCIGLGMLPVYWGKAQTAAVMVAQAFMMLLIITVLQLALSEKPDARE